MEKLIVEGYLHFIQSIRERYLQTQNCKDNLDITFKIDLTTEVILTGFK